MFSMFFVSRKKYEAMIQSYAAVQRKYDDLVAEHRELIDERDGLKFGVQTLRGQLEKVSGEFFVYKKNREKEI